MHLLQVEGPIIVYIVFIYIYISLGMSVAVGHIWPSLFHGSEGKKQKRPTTSQQGTSSKHWLLPFQPWELRLLWLQSVAWLFHKLEGLFHRAAPTCTRRHIASWTSVQLTSEAHWQLNLQKNRWWAACRWWRISKNFITKKKYWKGRIPYQNRQVEETILQTPLVDSARSSTSFSGLDVVVSMS